MVDIYYKINETAPSGRVKEKKKTDGRNVNTVTAYLSRYYKPLLNRISSMKLVQKIF